MGRILAVDLGTKRVGLAVTDPLQIVISPLDTVAYRSRAELLERLIGLMRDQDVETVVIGLPVRTDSQEGEGCRRARNVARDLEDRGFRTVLWDESFSTRRAEEILRAAGASRKRVPQRLDRVAAAVILREYLEQGGKTIQR
jgi:putative Holliday junction resolvase